MQLKAVLEGLLFIVGDEGVSLETLRKVLEISKEELDALISELRDDYNQKCHGLQLEYYGERLKIVTKKEHAEYYKRLIGEESNEPLSQSSLETLAIIAYNEPVTRIMVDEIRGVNSAHVIKRLVFKNLVKEVGRSELPGRPILYGVTDEFLDYFGLASTKDLPELNFDEEIKETDLFNSKYKEEN